MKIDVPFILTVSSLLVFIGMWGILRYRNNLLRILLALQLIFLGSLFNFSMGSALFRDISGILFSLFIICLIGIQMVTALAIFLLYFRKHTHLISDQINTMKG